LIAIDPVVTGQSAAHDLLEPVGCLLQAIIDHHLSELGARGQLLHRGAHPLFNFVSRVGSTPNQPGA
jgi:hypothetical protein